jgi:hypothetical protein
VGLPERLGRAWKHSAGFSRAAAYTASVLVAAPFLYHIRHGSGAYLGLLEDDHFYYTAVADNLLEIGKSSYDGTTLTNGYHPLWFGAITALRALCGSLGPAFYQVLALVFVASMCVTFELGRRFARSLGASPALSAALAAVYAVGTGRLLASGMESALAVPLLLWWLVELARPAQITPRRAAWLGFIASLAILARLDLAIAVVLTIAGYVLLVRPPWPLLRRQLAGFALGGVLVPLYVAANTAVFGTPIPVSALAKRLTLSPGFSISYARAVALGTSLGPTIAIVLPLGLAALYRLWRRNPTERPAAYFAGGVALGFAFLFFFLNALTGWIFFGWYAYPLPAAALAAMVFICQVGREIAPSIAARRVAVTLLSILVVAAPLGGLRYYVQHGPRWSIADNSLLAMSYELSARLHDRQGLFAMGAVAGVAAYVSDKRVLQLEGIITDRRLVESVRRERPLQEVLEEYHADYLIVSLVGVPARRNGGCYLLMQPDEEWAGKRTAKMRGEICAEPIEHFFTEPGTHSWSVFPRVETFVWDLRGARWGSGAPDTVRTDPARPTRQRAT